MPLCGLPQAARRGGKWTPEAAALASNGWHLQHMHEAQSLDELEELDDELDELGPDESEPESPEAAAPAPELDASAATTSSCRGPTRLSTATTILSCCLFHENELSTQGACLNSCLALTTKDPLLQ